jgi:hypothetical protein
MVHVGAHARNMCCSRRADDRLPRSSASERRPDRTVYPKAGNGCCPIGLERMPSMYLLQQRFSLCDWRDDGLLFPPSPGAPRLGNRLFEAVREHLDSRGIKLPPGSILDVSIISAPGSTKSADGERDLDRCQARAREMLRTAQCCRNFCMARRRVRGATRPIARGHLPSSAAGAGFHR